jgi:tellurite resistance-related uncharacterized protein
MAERSIAGFHQDEEGFWVAELSCSHGVHLRHRPPFENRPWVESPKGRSEHLGAPVDCRFCDMPAWPEGLTRYKHTPEFDRDHVPAGLMRRHATKAGTWGRIVVLEGKLRYELLEAGPTDEDEAAGHEARPEDASDRSAEEGSVSHAWVLRPGIDGIVEPERPHRVAPAGPGPLRFRVDFYRRTGS